MPTGRRGPETFFSSSKSDDYFLIGEIGWHWDRGRLALGPWFHTGELERFDGGSADDSVGLMLSWVDLSDEAGFSKNETAIEFFYLCQLTGFLGLKGDLHYVLDPSGEPGADDLVVATLRIEVSF